MYHDYISQVVADYRRKKLANTIPQHLIDPTPGNLKEECIIVCHERFDKKDYNTLRTFFGEADDEKTCLKAIDRCGIDKFRPLVYFLREKTTETEKKNIELLAWLIDFKDRPFELGRKYTEANTGPADLEKDKLKEEKKEESIDAVPGYGAGSIYSEENNAQEKSAPVKAEREAAQTIAKPPQPAKTTSVIIQVAVITLAILASVLTGYFWPKKNKQQVFALTGHEACMFWAGDHYQPISCSQKLGDTLIVALDSTKLNHFKKITQPDTITRSAIGYVWYVKIDGNVEFYTAEGFHPLHRELRLRPVTLYMINKYIKSGIRTE